MKIHLQMETHDLREMLGDYFTSRGFEVLNTDELCSKFAEVFPEGLVVSATLAPPKPPPEASLPPETDYPSMTSGGAKNVVSMAERRQNPVLRDADLLDPTNYGNVPRRPTDDESHIDAEQEMRRLLSASSAIQAEKEREDARRGR